MSLSPAPRSCAGPCRRPASAAASIPRGGHEQDAMANHRERPVLATLRCGSAADYLLTRAEPILRPGPADRSVRSGVPCPGGGDAVFKALADPTRRALPHRLRERNDQTSGELCKPREMARGATPGSAGPGHGLCAFARARPTDSDGATGCSRLAGTTDEPSSGRARCPTRRIVRARCPGRTRPPYPAARPTTTLPPRRCVGPG
jgi:hypothetical protein